MDVDTVIQIISNVGFPIACCVAMFWLNNKNEERHQEEISELKNAIFDLKTTITSIISKEV